MKNIEIREMTTNDIKERISEERNHLVRLKLEHSVSSLENPMRIRYSRRLIARLETELTKRNLIEKKDA